MARPVNEEAVSAIRRSINTVLVNQGYKGASYQAVADDSGVSRAFVQHYFPKKELFLDSLISQLLSIIDEQSTRLRPGLDPDVGLFITGQVYFHLLQSEHLRKLSLDILESRSLTRHVIGENLLYQRRKSPVPDGHRGALPDDLVRIVGESYELLFRQLYRGEGTFDPAAEALTIVQAYLGSAVGDVERYLEKVDSLKLTDEELEFLDARVMEFILG